MTEIIRNILKNIDRINADDDFFDDSMYDLVFVLNESARGWILERICREIELSADLHCGWVFSPSNSNLPNGLPPAKAYFFSHYLIATYAIATYPAAMQALKYVYFTHPDFSRGLKACEVLFACESFNHIFCMNRAQVELLVQHGVESKKLTAAVGGVDLDRFCPSAKRGNAVLFVGGYYERKRPGRMIELVQDNPDIEFIIAGGHPDEVANSKILWENSPWSGKLNKLSNLKVVSARYSDYPKYYDDASVYVSLSELEGGPISLLEAMAMDVFPIVTDTGFARDVITAADAGTIVPVDVDRETLNRELRMAVDRERSPLREYVRPYTWGAMANACSRIVRGAGFGRGGYRVAVNEESVRWLANGWHSPEPTGVWSKPGWARLKFPFAGFENVKAISLKLTTFNTTSVRLCAKVNGTMLGEAIWTPGMPIVEWKLPERRTTTRLIFELYCEYSFIPSEIGIDAQDKRHLSVFISDIEVK